MSMGTAHVTLTPSSSYDQRKTQHDILHEERTYSSIWPQQSYKRITHSLGLAWTLSLWRGSIWIVVWFAHSDALVCSV
jgi:hypothetical protein